MRGRPKGALNRSTLRTMSRYDMERLPLDQLMFCMEFWREVCDTMKEKLVEKLGEGRST